MIIDKNCKYCDYLSKCSRKCEYDSILCKINRSFPKIVDKSYEELKKENQELRIQVSSREEVANKYKEVIDKAINKLNGFIDCCKAEKLVSGSDYLHYQYWTMFEKFNKQIKDILKEAK